MIKRSQNKKPYTRVNYKDRLFVLTDQYLIYYEVITTNVSVLSIYVCFCFILYHEHA